MKNFTRMFVSERENCSDWTNATKTVFVISVEDDMLSVGVKSGRDMYVEEINTAFGRFVKEYETFYGEKITRYERSKRYRFCFRQGSSGCQDTFIEVDTGDGFPTRRFLMHESCFGKSGGFRCFVYDFMDLCVTSGFFDIEDGSYKYLEDKDVNSDCEMQVVRPRLTCNEKGWTNPWEIAKEVTYLQVCREEEKEEVAEEEEYDDDEDEYDEYEDYDDEYEDDDE